MLPNKLSFNTIGGELSDYSPPTDPTTDLSATEDDIARADLAAMTRTITRAWVSFTVSGGAITIASNDYDAVYGNANAYKPIATYNGPGDYYFLFPTSIVDARGITQLVNLQVGWCNMDGDQGYFASAKRLSAIQFQVFVWSTQDGVLADPFPDTTKVTLFTL